MILSVSRRTDIPNYYADWFFNRIREGFVCVRNPMNPHQISRIDLDPEVVDCIVFWTKNPEPMLGRLEELAGYPYYFQFTLTGYGQDIEPGVPHKKEKMLAVFRQLSEQIGAERVIWRYDPILFNNRYTAEYHLKAFTQIAQALCGYTERCVISFVDEYAKTRRNMATLGMVQPAAEELAVFAGKLSGIARSFGMEMGSCAEELDLEAYGIVHNSCIDRGLIEKITGYRMGGVRDKNQRPACGCLESVDIGTYNTCRNGCLYCYANFSEEQVRRLCGAYDPLSPLLCGQIMPEDKVTVRKMKTLREGQYRFSV